jgi:hypothetical protein
MTYVPVVAIAAKNNVKFLSRNARPDLKDVKKTGLARLQTRIVFQCDYASFRNFMYELESAPEFMIVDEVTLSQSESGKPLALTIEMSTYYRASASANGT